MKVTIGELSERISVRYLETSRNQYGDIVKTAEQERCQIWAKVYPLTARNIENTPEKTNRISYRVTIRRRNDIKPDDIILWRGRRLKMLSPPYDLNGERIYTAFECEEVIEDGLSQSL